MSTQLKMHIIEDARALIASENHWCRRQMAFDPDGAAVAATDSRATKLCGYGALIAVAHRMTNDCDRAYRLAGSAVAQFGGSSVLIDVNDIEGHAAVLAMFDDVIARHPLLNDERP
jgi:hypothetical protein